MVLSKDFLKKAVTSVLFYRGTENGTLVSCQENEIDQSQEVGVSIDTRLLLPGELFFALKGAQVDGHQFIAQAFEKGACGVVISDFEVLASISRHLLKDKIIIQVHDTYQALLALAQAWRQQLTIPLVAITGSVGKTSTKELTKLILKHAGMNVYASYKNQNTLLGLCVNILKVTKEHEVAVFEVGINERGEMDELVDLLRPTMGLITCIAHAHGQGLGSLADISYEKRRLFKHMSVADVGIIYGDQDLLVQASYHHPIAKFGFKTRNQVQARKVRMFTDEQGNLTTTFILKWYGRKSMITMQGNHRGMVMNALAASTIAYLLNVSFDKVVHTLQTYTGIEERFQIKKIAKNRGTIISDCYNANPESMKAALQAFDQMNMTGSKIAVLGDMLELGHKEMYWHRQIGRILRKMHSITTVVLVGERAREIAQTAPSFLQIMYAKDWQEAHQVLDHILVTEQNLVLVKASFGIHLGKMVDALMK